MNPELTVFAMFDKMAVIELVVSMPHRTGLHRTGEGIVAHTTLTRHSAGRAMAMMCSPGGLWSRTDLDWSLEPPGSYPRPRVGAPARRRLEWGCSELLASQWGGAGGGGQHWTRA